jgi:hypothetical protein
LAVAREVVTLFARFPRAPDGSAKTDTSPEGIDV